MGDYGNFLKAEERRQKEYRNSMMAISTSNTSNQLLDDRRINAINKLSDALNILASNAHKIRPSITININIDTNSDSIKVEELVEI